MSDAGGLLEEIAGDDEWSRHQALERLRTEGAGGIGLDLLRDALDDDDDASRRSAARMAFAALGSPGSPDRDEAQRVLRTALRAEHGDLRVLAASALGEAGDPGAVHDLIAALEDRDTNVVAAVADALGVLGHPDAIGPLAERARTGDFWVRAAAIVALGRIRDPAALPDLARAGEEPGLEEPVIEALRSIGDPEALQTLGTLADRAPLPALLAAGAILCGHPEVSPPEWIAGRAPEHGAELRRRLEADDDPAAARLLGIAADPEDLALLLDRAAPPHGSDAALAGILAAPAGPRATAILDRLEGAGPESRQRLLPLLPPLREEAHIRQLVPYLQDASPAVRTAAAESLGRAPAARALPLLQAELDRRGASPAVLRAMGGLGREACLALTPLLEDPDPGVRRATAEALARCGGGDTAARLFEALERETDAEARAALFAAYGHAAGADAVDTLASALEDPDPGVRLAALEALGATGSSDALPALERSLERDGAERAVALRAIGDLGDPGGATLLEPFLHADEPDIRRVAAAAAVPLAAALPRGALIELADDADEWVRICAARALGGRGADSQDRLRRMAAEDPDPGVRAEARRALRSG